MKTIIPISVEDANTETLEKITDLIIGKYNQKMKIDFYHDRGCDYRDEGRSTPKLSQEIEAIFDLLGKNGQPYFIISTQPDTV